MTDQTLSIAPGLLRRLLVVVGGGVTPDMHTPRSCFDPGFLTKAFGARDLGLIPSAGLGDVHHVFCNSLAVGLGFQNLYGGLRTLRWVTSGHKPDPPPAGAFGGFPAERGGLPHVVRR